MSVTHYEPFPDADYAEKAMCGTNVGENYEYTIDWQYVSCKKCLKQRESFEAEIADINKHRSEQDGDFVEFMIKEGYYPKEIQL